MSRQLNASSADNTSRDDLLGEATGATRWSGRTRCAIDPNLFAPVLGDYFPWFLIANGLLTELLRRRRADDL